MRFRTTDALWVRLVDVGAALSARGYGGDGEVVVEVRDAVCPWNDGRWRVSAGGAERTDAAAELVLDVAALGSVYLGGFTFRQLADALRVEEREPGAIDRADVRFRTADRAPWCPEIFQESAERCGTLPRLLRRLLLCGLALSLVGAAPAAAHRDPTPNGFRYGFVIRNHVVIRTLLPFSWPAKGSITGVYGNDAGRRHPGIDIGVLRSLQVRAAAPGRVVHTGYVRGFDGYGKVVVERSGGYLVLYAHLSRVRVHAGELVGRGRAIGVAGCTGWCTGTHLHFEVRHGRRTLDPMRLLASSRHRHGNPGVRLH